MKNYNYYTNVRGGYNKLLLIISILLSLSLISCKNFLSGASMLEDLQNSIEYINEPYADVTINSTNAATESIIPAIGNYTKQYKKTDNIKIEFTPVSKYQFIKWTATPSDAVLFEDEKSLSTTATLINTDNPIKIEPIVLERATLSVTPVNTIENPKNSSITISSSIPLKLTPELLDQIEITVDDISVLENFQPPIINEENTTITFIPKRDKMIEIPSGVTKIVKVFVPKDYYYENYETKISLEKDFTYSFKINSTTLTSAEITVSCPASQGDISYTGTKTYYLDNEFSVTVTPNEAYTLAGWNIKYNDETDVEKSILLSETSNGGTTLFVKVLTGSVKPITITPKLELRGSVTVKFNAETGTITPAGEKKYYIGDSFKVEYTPSSNFQFVQWSVTPANAVTFETPSALTTTATIKKTDKEITIEAVCLQRSTVTFAPEIHSEGVPKNSAIVINFSNPIEVTEKDLEKISITMDNLSILEYYQTPPNLSEDKKTVTFLPRRDKLLNTVTGSEMKIVNVKVPGSFYYIEDDNKVSLKDDVIYSFKINSTTEERVKINFSCPSTEGELSYSTYKEYNLDEEITTTCTPKKEYTVTGWKICYTDGEKEEVDNSILCITPPEKNSNTITIKIQTGSKREVTVSPICTPRKKVIVDFDSGYGTTTPSEQKNYYNGDTFTVSFREDSEAQFTTWKVYDYETKTPVTNVITFSSETALETTCTVNEQIEKDYHVVVKAEDVMRPSVLSTTPIFDANGVYRDRRIIVMFDKPMDESSIYYNSTETQNLEAQGYTILKDNVHTSEKCKGKAYAYWDGQNENTIHFKNISISLRTDESKNMLKHYNPPYFDETDPTVLRIDPKSIEKQQDGTEIDLMPPAASDILVIISNNMGTKDSKSGAIITLTKNTRWNYYTNSRFDNEIPVFKDEFKVSIANDNTDTNGEELMNDKTLFSDTETSNYKLYNIGNKKLRVTGAAYDNGAGIGSIKWSIKRIESPYYKTPADKENLPAGQIDDLLMVGSDAEFKTKNKTDNTYSEGSIINLNFEKETEGLFRIDFVAYDKNDLNSETKSFYFVHDEVTPNVNDNIIYERSESGKVKLSWTNPAEVDFWKAEVYTQSTNGQTTLQEWDSSSSSYQTQEYERNNSEFIIDTNYTKTVESLVNGTKYQHKVLFYDYAGNVTEKVIDIDNKAPTLKTGITYERPESGKVKLSWKNPAEVDFWKAEVYTQSTNGQTTLQDWDSSSSTYKKEDIERDNSTVKLNSDYTKTVESLENGTKYQHKVLFYDYSGNITEEVLAIDNEAPTVTNEIIYERPESGKVKLSWKNPAEVDFWKAEVYTQSTDGQTTLQEWNSSSSTYQAQEYERNNSFMIDTNYTKTVESLVIGTKYQHKVLFYDYAGNVTEKVIDIDNEAPTLKTGITECRKEATKTTLSYALNESDYWKAEVYTQKLPEGENTLQGWTVTNAETIERPTDYTSGVSFGNEVSGLEGNTLVAGQKYQHKVVLVDYAGNESEPIDVAIDNTAPAKITNFYAGARNKKIDLYYTTPANDDFAKIELSYGSIDTNTEPITLTKSSSSSKQITGLTIGNSYSYYIRTVDYSGNKSEPVSITQKDKVSIGDICYSVNGSSVLCSNNYYSGSNIKPIGVVCDVTDYGNTTDYSKVRIWDLEEISGLIWESVASGRAPWADNDTFWNENDGEKTFNILKNSSRSDIKTYMFQNGRCYKYVLDYKRKPTTPVDWYVPMPNEVSTFIAKNYNVLATTYTLLKNNYSSTVKFSEDTDLWTGKPRKHTDNVDGCCCIKFWGQDKFTTWSAYRDRPEGQRLHCMAQVNLN